jgi:DUF971 family protein
MTPLTINVHKKSATLELVYPDVTHELSAEYLRVFSPSAEVKGHGPDQAVLQFGKKDVQFKDIEPQGNYALKLIFSDGHDSGIFSWDYLFELACNQQSNWTEYLESLEKAGKSRESLFIAVS